MDGFFDCLMTINDDCVKTARQIVPEIVPDIMPETLSETVYEIVPSIVPEIYLETIIVPEIVRLQQPEIVNEKTTFL